ncbi:MAG: substrate-binding domain-containing protein [Firmicutes bacterium]|nr:substrate-binding domain-containing protein [Bacillota bacterium]
MKKIVSMAVALCMCIGLVAFAAACSSVDPEEIKALRTDNANIITELNKISGALKTQGELSEAQKEELKKIADELKALDIDIDLSALDDLSGDLAALTTQLNNLTQTVTGLGKELFEIYVVSREDGSGTRDAFQSLVKDTRADSPTNGKALSATTDAASGVKYVSTMSEYSVTGQVISAVSQAKYGIGYVGMASTNDTVKTLKVNGVFPSDATVLDGTYKLQRPFVFCRKAGLEATPLAADFIKFIESSQGQDIVQATKLVKQVNGTFAGATVAKPSYTPLSAQPSGNGSIVIRGSTSMEGLFNNLRNEYLRLNTWAAGSMFDTNLLGSGSGRDLAAADTVGNIIGMSSSAFTNTALVQFNVALEGVAVIVNLTNGMLDNITINDLFDVYTGAVTRFSELKHVV